MRELLKRIEGIEQPRDHFRGVLWGVLRDELSNGLNILKRLPSDSHPIIGRHTSPSASRILGAHLISYRTPFHKIAAGVLLVGPSDRGNGRIIQRFHRDAHLLHRGFNGGPRAGKPPGANLAVDEGFEFGIFQFHLHGLMIPQFR
jgi:hypothetical protein